MKTKFRALAVIISALLLLAPMPAGSLGKVHGTVKNRKGTPLSGVLISLLPLDDKQERIISVKSDVKGQFKIDKLPAGEYALRIAPDGYSPVTGEKIRVTPGASVSLELILELLDLKGGSDDPQNWDLKAVLRASPHRRLIFRFEKESQEAQQVARQGADLPPPIEKPSVLPFQGSGTVKMLSGLGGGAPVTNFAYLQQPHDRTKYIFAGQISSNRDTFWRVRNILNYQMGQQQLTFSLGYSRAESYLPAFPIDSLPRSLRRNAEPSQIMSLALENQMRLLDMLTLIYGLEYGYVRSGDKLAAVSPEFQLHLTPSPGTVLKAVITARKISDADSLLLADGGIVSLSDSIYLTPAAGNAQAGGLRHFEVGVARKFASGIDLELSTYADRPYGSGVPMLAFITSSGQTRPDLFALSGKQAASEGVRVVCNKRFLDSISGSLAYVYANGPIASKQSWHRSAKDAAFVGPIRRDTLHMVSAQIDADITRTGTSITTILKWTPQAPLTTIDFFSDRFDVANSSLNLFIRQQLPVPGFLNLAGQWEALLDIRNLLDQAAAIIVTSSGEVLIAKTPRSFRGGIAFNFR